MQLTPNELGYSHDVKNTYAYVVAYVLQSFDYDTQGMFSLAGWPEAQMSSFYPRTQHKERFSIRCPMDMGLDFSPSINCFLLGLGWDLIDHSLLPCQNTKSSWILTFLNNWRTNEKHAAWWLSPTTFLHLTNKLQMVLVSKDQQMSYSIMKKENYSIQNVKVH